MADIIIKTNNYVFSYRVAGIFIQNEKILLQKASNDSGYAFPGGHVEFGEINEETLVREFREKIDAEVSVGELKWVGEIFIPWKDKSCHQICLYYMVDIKDESIPKKGMFMTKEQLEGRRFNLEFHWVPLESVKNIELYPTNAAQLIDKLDQGVQHFVYRE